MKTRKNKKLLVVVAMVLMIGLVAGMGAMTYSKYITTSSAPQQTATAAKWNYVLSVDAANLLGTEYKEGNADTIATTSETGTVVVKSSTTAKVVAPGTSGSMTITINGESEVLAQFKASITATSEIHFDDYYPIKWKLNGTPYNDITALNGALSALTAKAEWKEPEKAYKFDTTHTISWEWAFNGEDNSDAKTASAKDTLIGYKAVTPAISWSAIKDLTCATGVKYSEFVSGANDTEDETKFNNIKTVMTFTLTATIEQVQS